MAAVSQAGALGWACPGARAWRMACGQPWRPGRGRWPNHGKVQPSASIKTLEHRTAPAVQQKRLALQVVARHLPPA